MADTRAVYLSTDRANTGLFLAVNETMGAEFAQNFRSDNPEHHFEERRLGHSVPTVPNIGKTTSAFPLRMSTEPAEDPNRVRLKTEIVSSRSLWQFQIKLLLTKTATILDQQRWTILTAPPDKVWFTSDEPVICLNT